MKLTVIILTFNEKLHIERCIKSVQPLADRIVVIDSFSTDNTVAIAKALGADVYQRKWKNYADQCQWAIEQCSASTEWLMRMDADEYLEPGLQNELAGLLADPPQGIDGIYLKLKVFFYGKWIRYGGFYPFILLRIWRNGKGHIEQRWMDEHVVLQPGSRTLTAQHDFVDDNLKGITFWINKHNSYASREAVELLNYKYPLYPKDERIQAFDDPQARRKRWIKDRVYSRLPPYSRAFLYFFYRYGLRLGFLDGRFGFIWHFMQGFWYRLLVDVKVKEIETRSGGDVEKMKRILREEHGIDLS